MAKAPRRPQIRSAFPQRQAPKGGKMSLGGLQQQMSQLQVQMEQMQESLATETVSVTAGGGMITVVANGRQEIESVVINPQAVDPEDVEMLQDMILAAVNEALQKAKELADQRMGALTGGLDIPGLV